MENKSKHIRFRAAVMVADIISYTTMMQQEESEAALYRKQFLEVIQSKVSHHLGRIIHDYRGGVICIFKSALEAVSCAIIIRKAFTEMAVPVRIALHQGDIVESSDGTFGSAINIASIIETLALGGSILISEKIYQEIRYHKEITWRKVGCFSCSNLSAPIKIYSIITKGTADPSEGKQIRWSKLHSLQVQTALVRPYLSRHNPELLN